MSIRFTKLQGAGNDFILVADNVYRDRVRLAMAMCDRHYGIGADGLLVLLPSSKADFLMRIFNPDGSEAEACGNGLRCFARYILENKLIKPGANSISIETFAGTRTIKFSRSDKGKTAIQASMGRPIFSAREIPVAVEQNEDRPVLDYSLAVDGERLPLSFVSMGNPHAIHFQERPVADFALSRLGPEVEHHPIFPRRVNFEVARVISPELIEARVWERGAGETLACGSGAAAIAVIARLHGYVGSKVDIKLPGGVLNVEWNGTDEVFLSGSAEVVFTGDWLGEV